MSTSICDGARETTSLATEGRPDFGVVDVIVAKNRGGFTAAAEMIAGLNCKRKRLVLGNHDTKYAGCWEKSGLFESV